jgi:hypothetical protein
MSQTCPSDRTPDQKYNFKKTHRILSIRMIISVLFWPAGRALLADLRARIVPRFRCEMSDFDGLSARFFKVDWNPRMHSCHDQPLHP